MNKKKNITIDDLARMVQKGFMGTDGKVDGLAKRIDSLEGWSKLRFDKIDGKLENINKRLEGIVYRHEYDELETRVKDLENLLAVPGKRR